MTNFTVQSDDSGKRLDKYLTENLPETSRSQIKKLITTEHVFVNDKVPTVHQFIKEDDKIIIKPQAERVFEIPEIPIIYKNDDYLIINKPSGVLAHTTTKGLNEGSVADWVAEHYPNTKTYGEADRPGIVHRLDRDTSGVMIVAISEAAYDHFKKLFHDREIKKEYQALIHDHLPELSGVINKPIGRSSKGHLMAARIKKQDGKDREAITNYEVLKRYKKFDLVKAIPQTGRTHQIRVHFKSMGTPIVGDTLYQIHKQKEVIDLGRVFLHAQKLTFKDLNGEEQIHESPLPDQLAEFLKVQK